MPRSNIYRPSLWLYLQNCWTTIRANHDALKGILILADSAGQLAPWHLQVLEFNSEFVRRAGIKHQKTDTLSRLTRNDEDTSPFKNEIPLVAKDAHTHLGTHQQIMIKFPHRSRSSHRNQRFSYSLKKEYVVPHEICSSCP